MGARHQIFVIAKVNGQRYRSLAAVHAQWMAKSEVLITCSRLIKVLQDPENRDKLEHEIAYAGTLTEEQWETPSDIRWPMPMFPFVTTCLISGGSIVDTPISTRKLTPEPWNMAFDGGHNDTGITILDITEPEVRYCFTLLPADRGPDPYEDYVMVPLSGNEYMRVLTEPEQWTWIQKEAVNSLKTRSLINASTLNETWPGEPAWSVREEANWFKHPQRQGGRGSQENGERKSRVAETRLGQRLAAGKALSYSTSIEDFLRTARNEDLQTRISELGIPQSALKAYLDKNPHHITALYGVELLGLALKGAVRIDLQPFVSMSGSQILQLFHAISESEQVESLQLLDISFNQKVTIKELRQILETRPVIDLYVWNNPLLPIKELKELVHSGHVQHLIDSRLFLECFPRFESRNVVCPIVKRETPIDLQDTGPLPPNRASLPIKQLIWMHSSVPSNTVGESPVCIDDCDIETLYSILKVSSSLSSSVTGNSSLHLCNFQLDEAHMSIGEVFAFSTRLLKFLSGTISLYLQSGLERLSLVFPLMVSARSPTSPYAVSPLPPRMFCDMIHALNEEPITAPLHPIKPGEYTLLIILERELERVRYAFLTADEARQTLELSAHDLAASDSAAAKVWDQGIQQIKIRQEGDRYYTLTDAHVELCDGETVKKVIEVARRFGAM